MTPAEIEMTAYMSARGISHFLMLNKRRGEILFVSNGEVVETVPALTGYIPGDTVRRGEGSTPAGIHIMRPHYSDGSIGFKKVAGENIDYSIHAVIDVAGQNRDNRLKGTSPEQRRISQGCVNVRTEDLTTIRNFATHTQPYYTENGEVHVVGAFFVVLPENGPLRSIFKAPEFDMPK